MSAGNIISIISIVVSTVLTVVLSVSSANGRRKEAASERRAEARKQEALLLMEVMNANADLTYAIACAVKRGSPNGEIEAGIEAYNAAKKRYMEFLREQTTEHIN